VRVALCIYCNGYMRGHYLLSRVCCVFLAPSLPRAYSLTRSRRRRMLRMLALTASGSEVGMFSMVFVLSKGLVEQAFALAQCMMAFAWLFCSGFCFVLSRNLQRTCGSCGTSTTWAVSRPLPRRTASAIAMAGMGIGVLPVTAACILQKEIGWADLFGTLNV
jgi:hypothetical protein